MANRPSFWTVTKLWLCYLFPFIPAIPQIGEEEETDCLFIQAFGRNNYTDQELGRVLWHLRTQASLSDPDTFTLLKYEGFNPGESNRALARYAKAKFTKRQRPIIAQWEVVYCLFEMDIGWFMANKHLLDTVWPPELGYFATFHVKAISKERMMARGCSRPLEIAHPAMITRAVPIIWKLGLNPVVERIKAMDFFNHPLWVWDEGSVQDWTRDFIKKWLFRETLGRILHVAVAIMPNFVYQRIPDGLRMKMPGKWLAFVPA